ncbi:uncharacterized protein LOC133825304 [Humulus lupulus]|uniref:uncharacterized protein LOC133825304 n=1 Tax=Humulus lupulus TaxID=3486 RepID=UPI002B40F41C|nr:uncharacterized protein LOC133825304 [Humulus lupulus]
MPENAVTFIDNHDTAKSTEQVFPPEKVMLGYEYEAMIGKNVLNLVINWGDCYHHRILPPLLTPYQIGGKSFGLYLPSKVNFLSWRMIQNALPMALKLQRRKTISDATCSLCHHGWESVGHMLYFAATGLKLYGLRLLSHMFSKTEFEYILCHMWSIWSERNAELHHHRPKPASVFVEFASSYLLSYAQAKSSSTKSRQSIPVSTAARIWTPPATGTYKLNSDAALDSKNCYMGIGAVMRDSTGVVIAALSKKIAGSYKPYEIEALALLHSLNWLLNQGLVPHLRWML